MDGTAAAETTESMSDLAADSDFTAAFARGDKAALARRDAVLRSLTPPTEQLSTEDTFARLSDDKKLSRLAERRMGKLAQTEREQLDNLHAADATLDQQQAEAAAEAEAAAKEAAAKPVLPLSFAEETPAEKMAEANAMANQIIDTLEIDAPLAEGAIKTLGNSHAGRRMDTGETRKMSAVELAKFEFLLNEKLGENYDDTIEKFEKAVNSLPPKAGAWVRDSIASADPYTASWAVISLVNSLAKGNPK